jgi:hypothetical protein
MGAVATVTNSNPGGHGGKRRKIQTNQPQGKTSHRAADYGNGRKGGCAITALAMAAMPAAGVWALIERLVS